MDVQMPRVNGIEAPNDIEGDCVAALRAKNAGFAKTLLSFWNEERNRCGVELLATTWELMVLIVTGD
jgi:hypothetical protein